MTIQQLEPLITENTTWDIAVIQTSFRQPAAVGRKAKIIIANGLLIIADDDGDHPYKRDKDQFPLPVISVINIDIAHIHSVDYFTDKKIISSKKSGIVLP